MTIKNYGLDKRILIGLTIAIVAFALSACTAAFVEKRENLRTGMEKQQILSLLGQPMRIETLGRYQVWQYCVTGLADLSAVTGGDQFVALLIDDKLIDIASYNQNAGIGHCSRFFRAPTQIVWSVTPRSSPEVAAPGPKMTIPEPTTPTPRPLKKHSTGSGFLVSPAGHVLTNEHVVAECGELRVAGAMRAKQIASVGKIDLALLEVDSPERSVATFRGGRGVRTGNDIVVAGYPLHGLLSSELNVTKGIVSALTGPGDDRTMIQITAPVQPGNSGGPVLDASGNVVGVVVGKLNALRIARATGRLPENVNFAISAGTVRAFLDGHDVPYETARSYKTAQTADIAAKAKGYTVLIECWR